MERRTGARFSRPRSSIGIAIGVTGAGGVIRDVGDLSRSSLTRAVPPCVRAGGARQLGNAVPPRLTSGKEPLMLFVSAARPHFARHGPLQILRGAGGDQSPLNALAKEHPRPGRIDMSPTLVRKRAAAKKRSSG